MYTLMSDSSFVIFVRRFFNSRSLYVYVSIEFLTNNIIEDGTLSKNVIS